MIKNRKKVLLLCPHFMGYDELVKNFLCENGYSVIYEDTDKVLKKAREKYKQFPIFFRFILKLFPQIRKVIREKLLQKYSFNFFKDLEKIESLDFILAINGDGVSEKIYKKLFSNNPQAQKVLYIWDDFDWLFKQSHIKKFDFVASYNIEDATKYNFLYLPVFTADIKKSIANKKYDIAIIATASQDRIALAKKIYYKYKNDYKFYIYFYDKEQRYNFFSHPLPMPYAKYQDILAMSVSVLDIVRFGQRGPTTRIYDSILTETKVITMNKNIKKYPVYNSNILVLDDELNIPHNFIKTEYINYEIIPVSIRRWCQKLTIFIEEETE